MKIGEIWEYTGKFEPADDGRRWSDDEDGSWYMDRVRIVNLRLDMGRWGEMVEFEALDGEPHPMEAIYAMPRNLFLKEYSKVY